MFFPAFLISLSPTAHALPCMAVVIATVAAKLKGPGATKLLCYHFDAHRTGGTLDALDCRLKAGGIQVGHFLLGYVRHLFFGDLADFILVRSTGAFCDRSGAL